MDHLGAGGHGSSMGCLDIVNEHGDIRADRRCGIAGHEPDLPALAIGEEGDPAHVHDDVHAEYRGVLCDGSRHVINGENRGDAFDLHVLTQAPPRRRCRELSGTLDQATVRPPS